MSIESMNESNQISRQTALYGYIAEEAQQNRLSVNINRSFKANGSDAMMIPMNIREDDIFFTVGNMRDSHLSGAFIGAEYVKACADIVDTKSLLSEKIGACDVVLVNEKKLHGDYTITKALFAFLKEKSLKKIAVIGSGVLASAIALEGRDFEMAFYHEYIESLMDMSARIDHEIDINRLGEGTSFERYDAVIDASTITSLAKVLKMASVGIDLKSPREFSALKTLQATAPFEYFGYEELLESITKERYNYVKGNND